MEADELGRATFSGTGVRHCRCNRNSGADHGEDRQQVADWEHGIELMAPEDMRSVHRRRAAAPFVFLP